MIRGQKNVGARVAYIRVSNIVVDSHAREEEDDWIGWEKKGKRDAVSPDPVCCSVVSSSSNRGREAEGVRNQFPFGYETNMMYESIIRKGSSVGICCAMCVPLLQDYVRYSCCSCCLTEPNPLTIPVA